MTYAKIDVVKPGTNKGTGGDKKDKITIFDWDDVLTYVRDSVGVVVSSIVMKPGKYMIQVYGTVSSIAPKYSGEGDDDAEGFMQEVVFSHPGDELAIMEFIQNWTGKNIGIVVEKCSSSIKKQYGVPCAPLKLSASGEDTKDANRQTLTFKASQKSRFVPGHYEGSLTLSAPVATVAADATSINLASGEGQYQLTAGTAAAAAITGCTNPADGMVFTLLGSGGTYPSTITAAATAFLLKNGTTWTAITGSQITFKVYKDGASSYKFIEQSRQ